MNIKVSDKVLTPNDTATKDKCWINGIPNSLTGMAVEVTNLEKLNDTEVASCVYSNGEKEVYFEVKNLQLLPKQDFKVGDIVRLVDRLKHDLVCGNPPVRKELVNTIRKIVAINSWENILLDDNTRQNTYSLESFTSTPLEKRSSGVPENLLALLAYIEKLDSTELEFPQEYSYTTDSSKVLGAVLVEINENITIKYSNKIICLPVTDDPLKEYKKKLRKARMRWAGMLIQKEEFTDFVSQYATYWFKKDEQRIQEILNTVLNENINLTKQILTYKAAFNPLKIKIDQLGTISEICPDLKNMLIKDNATLKTYEREIVKNEKLIYVNSKKIEHQQKILSEGVKIDENEYEDIINLYKSKVIETVGINKGNLFVIFSPLIFTHNMYKSCPEHGPKCGCLTDEHAFYYIGRVKVEFHGANCAKDGCSGFKIIPLTFPKLKYIHPHLAQLDCDAGCYNQFEDRITSLRSTGQISPLLLLIRQFLTFFNPHHGQVAVEHFENLKINDNKKPQQKITDGSFQLRFLKNMFPYAFKIDNKESKENKIVAIPVAQ